MNLMDENEIIGRQAGCTGYIGHIKQLKIEIVVTVSTV